MTPSEFKKTLCYVPPHVPARKRKPLYLSGSGVWTILVIYIATAFIVGLYELWELVQ